MKVLVTGGTGFIGSHTIVELQKAGYDVVAVDNLENSEADVATRIEEITGKTFPLLQADVRDKRALSRVFEAHADVAAVIHFAAYKAVGESVGNPLKYYENNIGGTANLLSEMKDRGIDQLVFSSSCTVYGNVMQDQLPVTEASPTLKANSPYGNTKKVCEEMVKDVCASSSQQAVILRYFNPIGAHESAKIGELPIGTPNNLVPFITQTAIGKRPMLTVFGNDYPTPDGTCIRDYIHVVDLAIAHVKAIGLMEKQQQKEPVSVFNIGTGQGTSVLEAIRAFEKVTGLTLNYQIGPRRAGDVAQMYASCTKAAKELGWTAERDIEHAMRTAWNWEKQLAKKKQ